MDALHLALKALDVGPSDEVIVPSNTYIATWLAVSQLGASPVPVEPDADTYNIDPSAIEAAITSKTKAILAVNLYGQACDYDPIIEVARTHGLKVAIDNAQAHGARYQGKRVGALADIECHSFYPSKNLGAFGEAGAITTDDAALADKIRVLRNYGSRVRYENEVPGYNNRIDELQAAFLRVKLRKLDDWTERRRNTAHQYLSQLDDISELVTLPSVPDWADPVWHLFVVRHPQRDALQKELADQGIQARIHYPTPPHLSGAYADLQRERQWKLPVAEQLAQEVLSLPIHPHQSDTEVHRITQALIKACRGTDKR